MNTRVRGRTKYAAGFVLSIRKTVGDLRGFQPNLVPQNAHATRGRRCDIVLRADKVGGKLLRLRLNGAGKNGTGQSKQAEPKSVRPRNQSGGLGHH
jgi:hypothetical protein